MPRPAASPEQRARQRRRIRRAAAQLYRERGLDGVSVRAVAQRAGVSTGTIYLYFDNLTALMRSLWMEPVAAANERLEALAREHEDPVERVRALLEAYADFARANPEVYRGAFLFVRPASVPRPDVQEPSALPFFRLLRDAVREGQQRGAIRLGDPDELAQLLWAGVHGAFALPTNAESFGVAPPEQLGPAMIRLLMASIEP